MRSTETESIPILLTGESIFLASVAICLVDAGHMVKVYPENLQSFNDAYNRHMSSKESNCKAGCNRGRLTILKDLTYDATISLAIAVLPENLECKVSHLSMLEKCLTDKTVIAINTETYGIDELSDIMKNPSRLIGLNWAEPAHTTFFLEIISNVENEIIAQNLLALSKNWDKDAYVVKNSGVRSLLISAMAREASFLVDNNFASVEDIDRACRNDMGYYMPFAGNCRYMDLMGTYAYGMVMKDLNPVLSKDQEIPEFFKKIEGSGGLGMQNGSGFYTYSDEEVIEWKEKMEKFSYKINKIIDKYPFNNNIDTHLD